MRTTYSLLYISDQRKWKDNPIDENQERQDVWEHLKAIGDYFGIPCSPKMSQDYIALVHKITNPTTHPDLCRIRGSSPSLFWMKVLSSFDVDPDLERLIKTAIGNTIDLFPHIIH